ncbi:MAG TPA: metallophosphoesterase [Chloroflexota bacterium]|nr:metallophosphoesterase [Chloroflexota bacterium]
MEWQLSWPVRIAATVAALGVAGLVYGTLVERHHLRLRRVTIETPDLPAAFDGYRIVQLSDFHIGGRGWSSDTVKRAVVLAMAQRGDLIVLTGDFFEYTAIIAACPELFGPLRAPDGVLAVLGNHDYHHHGVRVHRIIQALQDLGVRVLRNQSHCLRRGNQDLWIVGVDDPHSGHDDLPSAVAGVPASARPIMLVHYPDFTWRLPPNRYALALSGHTHGSQVRLPLVGLYARRRIANTRFSHGVYDVNGTPVFVTTGVGTSGRPLRIRARPEVAVIRLRARGHAGGQ